MMKLLTLLLLLVPTFAFSQDGKWVEVTAHYVGTDVTPEEGKRRALDLARGEAIKKVVGVKTTEETYWNQLEALRGTDSEDSIDVFSRISRTTASGRIIKEEKDEKTTLDNEQPVYTVTLRACVVPDELGPDPEFQVSLNIDRDVYYDRSPRASDEVRLRINSSKECYLYLFNILSGDSVQLLMPTDLLPHNEFHPAAKAQKFEETINAKSIHFRVGVPAGKSRTKEALYLVATKWKIDFPPEHLSKDGQGVISTRVAAWLDIMNWLVSIPADMRTEAFKSYEIRKWGGE